MFSCLKVFTLSAAQKLSSSVTQQLSSSVTQQVREPVRLFGVPRCDDAASRSAHILDQHITRADRRLRMSPVNLPGALHQKCFRHAPVSFDADRTPAPGNTHQCRQNTARIRQLLFCVLRPPRAAVSGDLPVVTALYRRKPAPGRTVDADQFFRRSEIILLIIYIICFTKLCLFFI